MRGVSVRKAIKGFVFRAASVLCVLFLVTSLSPASVAYAMDPPVFNPETDIAPPDGVPGPDVPMKQDTVCATSVVLDNSQFETIPASSVFGVQPLHGFATGAGQTVAVIDSGVNPNVRLPRLQGGGDYIMSGDGLSDCDHHGTLVAGIIAAQPSATDSFVGVAPDATVLSIRQTSSAFTPDKPPIGYNAEARSASNVSTLARSIVHAANLGATVINFSVTACVEVNKPVDLRELFGAIHYAAEEKNVVLVASAGNTGGSGGCQSNPGPSPDKPEDERGWGNVQNISLPSLYSQYVLSVGGSDLSGLPYMNSMAGPWVGVAAPAINIISLDPTGGDKGSLVNGQLIKGVPSPMSGTSFASAYVSGLAADIRQKYPSLSAAQVIRRITNTAHRPSQNLNNLMGFGLVDAKAALTDIVDVGEWHAPTVAPVKLPAPPPPPVPDHLARNITIIAVSVFGVLCLVVLFVRYARNSNVPRI